VPDSNSGTIASNARLEIKIQCPPVLANYLQELLWTIDGVESVSEEYRADGDDAETRLSDLTAVTVLTCNPLGEDLIKVLMVENPRLMKVTDIIQSRWVEEKDWAENWKQYWHPTQITERLTICPTWEAESYTPKSDDEIVIKLDPECAFGTGTHETTQLMLKALDTLAQDIDFSNINLLDVGTGSGILTIYAAKLGCKDIRGIDNDPLAVLTATKNAQLNDIVVDFTDTPLADLCRTKYDVMLANIIAPVILELFDEMLLRLNPGGRLIASGLVEKSVGQIETAMREAGFTDIQKQQQGDWFAIGGVYRG
jgi:ribosomal protein L11 methyltransferase